ncbi:MAG: reverse transcriptase domain-containing protein [Fusobacteriaceae bacterium]
MEQINKEELERAYLELKKLIFYENNVLLHLKMQIADFEDENQFLNEDERDKFFKNFSSRLNKKDEFKDLIKQINFKKVMKKLEEKSKEKSISEILNGDSKDKLEDIKKIISQDGNNPEILYNYIIDCPIELHIISVLWIFKEGYKLDKEIKKYSYGYRLNLNDDEEVISGNIFKRYAQQYQLWKNNGIERAKGIIEEDENVVLVNLDLKKFYYNIDHKKLIEKIKLSEKKILESHISKIIFKVNTIYDEIVSKDIGVLEGEKEILKERIIPIGLYSSPILANFYLRDLDEYILKECQPDYYGRYVDDIFMVFREYKIDKEKVSKKKYLEKKFSELIDSDIFIDLGIEKSFNKKILLENDKQEVTFLSGNKKKIHIQNLENNFLEKASTFAFLPNEKEIEKLYNKISIDNDEDFKSKKYTVSVYLSKILDVFSGVDKKASRVKIKETAEILTSFFDEENLIKYAVYYEKVFTFLVMGELVDKIEVLYNKIDKYFDKIEKTEINAKFLKEYLKNSLYFALSLNPKLIKRLKYGFKKNISKSSSKDESEKEILKIIFKISQANMFKHRMINYPMLNYLSFEKISKYGGNSKYSNINFFETRYFDIVKSPDDFENLELCGQKMKLSPRFIHLEELNIFYIKRHILGHDLDNSDKSLDSDYLAKSKKNYGLNFYKTNDKYFEKNIIEERSENLQFYKIQSEKKEILDEVKIGIASMSLNQDALKVLDGKQNLSFKRKEKLIDILNQAKKYKVDILVFPEVSIPFQWIKFLNKFSRENQMLITGGLEHISCPELEYNGKHPKYAFNYLFTILPFTNEKYKSSFIKIRLKNHYAPGEVSMIEGKNFSVPKLKEIKYDIFSWKGIHFSNFNCFELSDIKGRSTLKNYIDILIASVFNKDTYYFKNILESTARDLHVFIAQSNTSIYGDCEILQPTKKDNMIVGSIKGGINDNLLVEKINIRKLREFQLLNNNAQKDGVFKLTPPGIDPNIVKNRMKNELDKHMKNIREKEREEILKERERIIKLLVDNGQSEENIRQLVVKQ